MPISNERRRNLDMIMANKHHSLPSSPNKPKSFSIDAIMNREPSKSPSYSTPSPDHGSSGSPFRSTPIIVKNHRPQHPINCSPPVSSSLMPGFMENLSNMAAAAAAAASSAQASHLPFFHSAALYGQHPLLMQQQPFLQPGHFNPWINRQSRIFPGGPPNLTDSSVIHGMHGIFFPPYGRKPKRIRTAFSPSQLLRLEHAFEKNHYVVGTERKQLAQNLALSETQVKIWFQNRRTKHKRLKCDGEDGQDAEGEEEEGNADEDMEQSKDCKNGSRFSTASSPALRSMSPTSSSCTSHHPGAS